MTLINDDIFEYFNVNYQMVKEGWSLVDLELMTPFDRQIYVQLYINELKKRQKEANES